MTARIALSATLLLVGAVLTPAVISGAEAAGVEENYTAITVNMNPGLAGGLSRLTIRVRGWSSDEQRAALLKVLAEKGSAALVDALREEPSVGTLSLPGTLAYDLRYARAVQQGETRYLILATDRPVAMVEIRRNTRSLEKGVTIVLLELGPDGKGKGKLLVGAELSLDPERHEITVEHLGTTPVDLNEVERK